jgi:hypothetical protein
MSVINELHSGTTYSPKAMEKLRTLLLEVFPYVARDLSTKENQWLEFIARLPPSSGGLH